MRLLLQAALKNRHHLILLIFTIVGMCLFVLASQLEVFAIGVMTKKGPDFFELFAPEVEGQLSKGESVNWDTVGERWQVLDPEGLGVITKEQAAQYMREKGSPDKVGQAIQYADSWFHFQKDLGNLAIFLIAVALLKAAAQFIHRYSTRLVAIRVSRDLRQQYFEHLQSLPMEFFQRHDIGGLSARAVGDACVIAEALTSSLINYIQSPFVILTTLLWCFLTSWQLTLLIFCGFPLIAGPIYFIARKVKKIAKQMQKNQEGFTSVLIDFFSGIQTVKVFAMEEFSLKKYSEQNSRMAALEQKSARYDLSSRPIVHTMGVLCVATAMLYGLHVLQMNVTSVLVYCALLYLFYEPIKKFAEENNTIQRGVAAAERMFEVMSLVPAIQDAEDAQVLDELKDAVTFEDVWFKYEDDWILKGLSFTAKKGQTVALVGPTGAGKSTIVQLLPRLYDPQKGQVCIDGRSVSLYTQRSLRDSIAYVPQKPFLFMDTIAQNIAFGRSYSREQVEMAARRAHADEFVCALPEGYDSYLAEAGKNLSGGQQQRLAIARALVKEASILILDEATSSLDTVSESRIKSALSALQGEITQIIIAHRLTTIENADKIVFIDQGVKIAEGTKDELLESCLPFKLMWEMRHSSHEDS